MEELKIDELDLYELLGIEVSSDVTQVSLFFSSDLQAELINKF